MNANSSMICLYWNIGKAISEKQENEGWGAKVIDRMAKDLKDAFPDMLGFSPRNIKYMRKFAECWPDFEFVQQVVAQIPWRTNRMLLDKLDSKESRVWYAYKTIENGWSSAILELQIQSCLMERSGKSVNNFEVALPPMDSDMANQIFKDPYLFDFLGTDVPRREVEIERKLTEHIQKFLLELGQGFAFVGRVVHLNCTLMARRDCSSATKKGYVEIRKINMSKILLLEDDLSLVNGLSFAFKKQGFELAIARTLKEANELWGESKYDLLVLDVTLPDGTGFEFCEKVRKASKVPIIFLTASDEETNIIMGLDIGGDDYITKPFKLGVLVSRINALLRRANDFNATDTELQSNGIKVLLLQGQVFKNEKLIDLTAAEYKLLCLFMRNPNRVLTKAQILDELWDCDGNYIDSSTLTVYMRRLRMKIEDNPSEPKMLLTVRGMGYKWSVIG